jgi:hypothetical protein
MTKKQYIIQLKKMKVYLKKFYNKTKVKDLPVVFNNVVAFSLAEYSEIFILMILYQAH